MSDSRPQSRNVLPSDAVPTSWLDPLLTGPDAVLKGTGPWGCPDIEALLRAVRARIKSIESEKLTLVPHDPRNDVLEEAALAIENADTTLLDEIGAAHIVRSLKVT